MFLPYTVDVPMVRIPWMNWALIGVTSVISLVILIGMWHHAQREPGISPQMLQKWQKFQEKGDWESEEARRFIRELELHEFEEGEDRYPGALEPRRFSFWQLFSHQFVHGDIFHLLGNMFFLFCFGNAVNAKLGQITFLASYLALGMIGGLGWLVLGNGAPMVGASGAIMGIIGIFFVFFPRNLVTVLFWWRGGTGSFDIPAFWVILSYMVLDLIGTIRQDEGIAYVSHLAGEVCGAGLAVTLLLTKVVKSTKYEENLLQVFGLAKKRKARSLREI